MFQSPLKVYVPNKRRRDRSPVTARSRLPHAEKPPGFPTAASGVQEVKNHMEPLILKSLVNLWLILMVIIWLMMVNNHLKYMVNDG